MDASVTHPSGLRHACSILAKMVTDGYSLSAVHHDTLILGFGQARNLEAALAVFQVTCVCVSKILVFRSRKLVCLLWRLIASCSLHGPKFLFSPLNLISYCLAVFRIKLTSDQLLLLLPPTPLLLLLPNLLQVPLAHPLGKHQEKKKLERKEEIQGKAKMPNFLREPTL